uniref:Uncharacterized protein n=1 Tax=Arundo donax TaxID=35708 RepID=A0A0A9HNV0_ARUDO
MLFKKKCFAISRLTNLLSSDRSSNIKFLAIHSDLLTKQIP